MEFVASRKNVLAAVKVVSGAAAPEGAAEAPGQNLAGVMIEAKRGTVTFSATDKDLFLSRKLVIGPDCITVEGKVLVPAKRLAAILSDSSQESVQLTTSHDGKGLDIKTAGGRLKLSAMVQDEYPQTPDLKDGKTKARINSASFQLGVEKCGFCVGKAENANYALGGLMVDLQKDGATMVGTDTHRISVYEMDGEAGEGSGQFILPLRAAAAINDMAALDGEQINLQTNGNSMRVDTRGGFAIVHLIEGVFPRYTEVLPKDFATVATMNKDALIGAVKAVSRVADDNTNRIELAINGSEDHIVTAATGSERGEGAIQVAAEITGAGMKTGHNHKYLGDALKAVYEETVKLEANGENDPLGIREGTWTHIIMPIRNMDK